MDSGEWGENYLLLSWYRPPPSLTSLAGLFQHQYEWYLNLQTLVLRNSKLSHVFGECSAYAFLVTLLLWRRPRQCDKCFPSSYSLRLVTGTRYKRNFYSLFWQQIFFSVRGRAINLILPFNHSEWCDSCGMGLPVKEDWHAVYSGVFELLWVRLYVFSDK
jgi:hypothetical protein